MQKRFIYRMICLLLTGMLLGCGEAQVQETSTERQRIQKNMAGADPMRELLEDRYGDYRETGGEIAFVSEGAVMDGDCNEAIYEGIQIYALSAGVTFSYYNVEGDGLEGRLEALRRAVGNKAQIVVCNGYDFGEAVEKLQEVYPKTAFLLIDGALEDSREAPADMEKNVHRVYFREEEAGYLAGYLAVMEGYRSLGFIGGEEEPATMRYGYGYLQGIDDAARNLDLGNVEVNYWYAGTCGPSRAVYAKAQKWYSEGTEIIFACGGDLYASVLEAADKEGGLLVGADVDRSGRSERFLTSAEKGIANAVVISLDEYYAAGGKWPDRYAGKSMRYGVTENCAGIPVLDTEWRFRNVTMENFYERYKKIRRGEISVSGGTDEKPQISVAVSFLAYSFFAAYSILS